MFSCCSACAQLLSDSNPLCAVMALAPYGVWMPKFAVHLIQKPAFRLSRELSLGLKDPRSGMERSIDVLMAKQVRDSIEYVAGLEYR